MRMMKVCVQVHHTTRILKTEYNYKKDQFKYLLHNLYPYYLTSLYRKKQKEVEQIYKSILDRP